MKTTFLILCTIFALLVNAYSQNNVLVLKNKKSGKEKIILPKEIITVVSKSEINYNGSLNIDTNSKSKTEFKIDRFPLSTDNIIKIQTKSKLAKNTGLIMTVTGAMGIVFGIYCLNDNSIIRNTMHIVGTEAIMGSLALIISGFILISSKKTHRSANWDIYIMNGTQ